MYLEPLIVLISFLASLGGLYSYKGFQHRFERSSTILNRFLVSSKHGIPPQETRQADCIAVVPEFKKSATAHESASGYGFLSCRNENKWSAPAAVVLEGSKAVMLADGRGSDIVMISMNRNLRSGLVSRQFASDLGQAALHKNGEFESDTNGGVVFFVTMKSGVTEFALNNARLKADDVGNKALYGKPLPGSQIIAEGTATPKVARDFVKTLTSIFN